MMERLIDLLGPTFKIDLAETLNLKHSFSKESEKQKTNTLQRRFG